MNVIIVRKIRRREDRWYNIDEGREQIPLPLPIEPSTEHHQEKTQKEEPKRVVEIDL
jgi:hypothetical protein